MAKPVRISTIDAPFPTQKAALAFFDEIKSKYAPGEHLNATDRHHLQAVYEDYCRITNWPIPASIAGFLIDNKVEEISPGQFRTQKCFWYHFKDGTKEDFSIIKAIQAISRSQNS